MKCSDADASSPGGAGRAPWLALLVAGVLLAPMASRAGAVTGDAQDASAARAQGRVLEAAAHHLGDDTKPEWVEAGATPEGVTLSLSFEGRDTGAEQTLFVTQRNVSARWELRINGTLVARLRPLEARREVAYRVPPGVLVNGSNTLQLEAPDPDGGSDDITCGPLRLAERPLADALGLRRVRLDVRASGTGAALPARVTLTDAAGVPVPQEFIVRPAGATELPLRDGLLYTGDAPTDLLLPSYAIDACFLHGPEWSLARATIPAAIAPDAPDAPDVADVPDASRDASAPHDGMPRPDPRVPLEVSVELRREVDTTGFIAADTHLHTLTFSGHGDANLDERLWTLAGEGVELAIATDHNHVTDYRPRQQQLGLGPWYTAVSGDEVTTDNGHFNAFPLDPSRPPPEHRLDDWVALVAGIRAAGAQTVVLNHPRWPDADRSPFARFGLDTLTGARATGSAFTFDAMELTNSTDAHPDPLPLFTDWFALLNRGERIAAVGSSDSHTVGDPVGQGRTWVPSATDDPAAIDVNAACRAIAQGRTSFGQGIFTRLRVDGRFTMGDLVPAGSGHVNAVLTVRAPAWVVPRIARLFLDGVEVARTDLEHIEGLPTDVELPFEVTLSGHDAWLVAVVTGDAVEGPFWPAVNHYTLGATNPVFLDANGDGEYTAPRVLAATRLARLRAASDRLSAVERAALLRGDAAVLLHMLDQLHADETALRDELAVAASTAGGPAAAWASALLRRGP